MPRNVIETILDPAVQGKLKEMAGRHDELIQLLADPAVVSNPNLMRAYTRERGALIRPVKKYCELLGVLEQKKNVESLASSREEEPEFVQLAQEELMELSKKEETLCEELEDLLLQDPQTDDRSVIMEIRSGTGGNEAGLFALDLFRMYTRYAEQQGWGIEAIDTSSNDAGGLKQVIFSVEGRGAFRRFKFESGVHRVQRVPATEANGRIHTSAATVAVLPEVEEVEIEIRPEDLHIECHRSSGPGGQNVNKTSSAVRITHLPTGLIVDCQDERSQHKNKTRAMRVLRARLYDQMKTQQESERAAARRSMVGSGDRSEKIRTYNFPQDRLTDHRINLTTHGLQRILDGELDKVIDALLEQERAEKLKNFSLLVSPANSTGASAASSAPVPATSQRL